MIGCLEARLTMQSCAVPTISRFLGIVISMYHNDHLPPHFHASYGDDSSMIGIHDVRQLQGQLPPRVLGLVIEWATLHQDELRANWELARQRLPLKEIDPLR